jgi:hypothetical protein
VTAADTITRPRPWGARRERPPESVPCGLCGRAVPFDDALTRLISPGKPGQPLRQAGRYCDARHALAAIALDAVVAAGSQRQSLAASFAAEQLADELQARWAADDWRISPEDVLAACEATLPESPIEPEIEPESVGT